MELTTPVLSQLVGEYLSGKDIMIVTVYLQNRFNELFTGQFIYEYDEEDLEITENEDETIVFRVCGTVLYIWRPQTVEKKAEQQQSVDEITMLETHVEKPIISFPQAFGKFPNNLYKMLKIEKRPDQIVECSKCGGKSIKKMWSLKNFQIRAIGKLKSDGCKPYVLKIQTRIDGEWVTKS